MADFKLFTLQEAEQTLPLVRRIVQDLTAEYPGWRAAVSRYEVLSGGARAEWGETGELLAARGGVTRPPDPPRRPAPPLPPGARGDRLRVQGLRCRPGGLLLAAGGPADLPLLAPGGGADHPLARGGRWLPRAPAHRRRDPVGGALVMKVWLFLHLLGFTLWIGGAIASMVAGGSGKREGREALGVVARAQAAIQKALIGPGALITVLSGLILTFGVTARTGE